jgi:thiamine-phosphate pyrophosphorylase
MLNLPPIYPITDPDSGEPLSDQIQRLGACGFPLVQFRGKHLDPRVQQAELLRALRAAAEQGGWPAVCVNDRADLAVLAAQEGMAPWGVHLGQGDLPPSAARGLPGLEGVHLGTSTHDPGEWGAADPACDHAGVGPFRATATKPGHAEPIGLAGLAEGCRVLRALGMAPVAIGGLTPADARACFEAGAEALAMTGAVAHAADPAELLWQAQLERWRVRPPLAPRQGIVLLGGSGAGKSTLARHLARCTGLVALDVDQKVEADSGMAIPVIFRERGEAGFRALEAATVRQCLRRPAILALGAGAWQDPATRAAVREAGFAALWMADVPERAWARVGGDPHRPLAAARSQFMARWASRISAWSEAPMILPLGRSPRQLAQALVWPWGRN